MAFRNAIQLSMRRYSFFPLLYKPFLECERSRVKKAFLCTRTMGVKAPSLHRESTDSLIHPFSSKSPPADYHNQQSLFSRLSAALNCYMFLSTELRPNSPPPADQTPHARTAGIPFFIHEINVEESMEMDNANCVV